MHIDWNQNKMKTCIIIIFGILTFCSIFLAYKIGFHRGYNYTFSIQDKEDVNNIQWTSSAKRRDFGSFYVLTPEDIKKTLIVDYSDE